MKLTPARRRAGQAPLALFVKAVLRPIFKALYYLIRGMRKHKIATLIAIILLLASIGITSYALTGTVPLFGNNDNAATDKALTANPQLSNAVKAWIIALRDGDLNTLDSIQKSMPAANQPANTSLYVMQYSQPYSGIKWNSIHVTGPTRASDTLVDTYIEVNMTPPASAASQGATADVVIWHFTTLPESMGGQLFSIEKVSDRLS